MKCPKCGNEHIRKNVLIDAYCDADNHDLSKSGIKSKDVELWGVFWDSAVFICTKCCYTWGESVFEKKAKAEQERDELKEKCNVLIKALEEIKDISPDQWDHEDTQWSLVAGNALSEVRK